MGAYAMPELYTEAKYAQEMAIVNSKEVVAKVMEEFGKKFGRSYNVIEAYNTQKADCVFVALGSVGENIKTAINELKEQGKEAGLVSIRLLRPFPSDELISALKDKKRVVVIERVMPGGAANGPLFHEISSLMYLNGIDIKMENYIAGLGGRDILPESFIDIFNGVIHKGDAAKEKNYDVIGVRG